MKTYTEEEVIQLLVKERQRAVNIAYDFFKKNQEDYETRAKVHREMGITNSLAFIKKDIADECRLVGNAISDLNALSVSLGKDIESKIREQLNNNINITRVEVIDHFTGKGRVFTLWQESINVELSYQDDNRTLKIFISKKQ